MEQKQILEIEQLKIIATEARLLREMEGKEVYFAARTFADNLSRAILGRVGATFIEFSNVTHFDKDYNRLLDELARVKLENAEKPKSSQIYFGTRGTAQREIYNKTDISLIVEVNKENDFDYKK